MGILLKSLIGIKGKVLKNSLDKATKKPYTIQKNYLLKILEKNINTEYGKKYNFAKIYDEKDFQKNIPINQFNDLEPYIERIKNGHKNILTSTSPFMFNLTSGTSDKPKFIPITAEAQKLTANLMHQWLYRTLLDHPAFLDNSNFCIAGPAIEGYAPSGIPYGCASGMIYKSLPRLLHSSYVLPVIISNIKNYDLRYYIMARLALEKEISFIATPNPTTLIRIAEIGIQYQEEIIRSIHNGLVSGQLNFERNENDSNIIDLLKASLRPNLSRAKFLSNVIKNNGGLLTYCCWPALKLIACWLGGSIGFQADKLTAYYGKNVPRRDIGYFASEGCITLPFKDYTSSGILALQNNYYEFIPENQIDEENPQILLSHELESGKRYKIILTNENGLYRYDINDIVQVEEFYNQAPVLAFIRKSNDILNITGEKLHVNHLIITFQKIESKFNIKINQFRAVSNFEKVRYDIFLDIKSKISEEFLKNTFLPSVDKFLSEVNIEYNNKRKSKRLNPPCLHIMDSDWEECIRSQFIKSGKRDIQYKWYMISPTFFDLDKEHIQYTIEM